MASNPTATAGSVPTGPPDSLSLASVIKMLRPEKEYAESTGLIHSYPSHPSLDEGSDCSTQTLYEGPPKCSCCTNWIEEYPDDLRILVEEQPETKQKALVIRMKKSHSDDRVLSLDSIVVQSGSLKKTLQEVFEGYEGITPSLKKLVFKAPFHPFYYRWQTLQQTLARQKSSDPESAKYTQLLVDTLHKELIDVMSEVKDLLQHNVITYPLLWALFEPGKLLVSSVDREDQYLIHESCSYDKTGLDVKAKFVDWDGKRFGYADSSTRISLYEGTREITSLGVYPAEFHGSKNEAEAKAMIRGKKFQNLRGLHYKTSSRGAQSLFDERLMVDADAYYSTRADSYYSTQADSYYSYPNRPVLAPLTSASLAPGIDVTDDQHDASDSESEGLRPHQSGPRGASRAQKALPADEQKRPEHYLTDRQLLLCNTHVRGFALKTKSWAQFKVTDISDVKFNEEAFDQLILPKGYKNLVLSFLEGSHRSGFDDIIEGKGLGIIMLLVGPPGTGKTLTAEAVAERLNKPLYILSAGDLGQDARSLETRLISIFKLTEKWDAVLLFDECDVFLQKRSEAHMAHNEIVAVFLRRLEYYRGILLMTTNRSNSIDRAFSSRIHLALHYPDLATEAKQELWRRFARLAAKNNTLSDEDIEKLSLLPMNGREVKNVIKVATLLSCQEGLNLGKEQIDTVLRATGVIKPDADI